MKRKLIIVGIMIALALTLTACDKVGLGGEDEAAGQTGGEGELPLVTRLLVGTFKLEETEQAVTAEQAGELLPLWRTYRSLTQSETTASQELEALERQLQETMTQEQMRAIEGMELAQEDLREVMENAGVDMAARQPDKDMEDESARSGERERSPEGGIPGGGGGGRDSSDPAIQTRIAERAGAGGAGTMANAALLDALIELLASRAA